VAAFLEAFVPIARKYGIAFQPLKFTIACNPDAIDHVKAVMRARCGDIPDAAFRPWCEATMMGAAVGGRVAATAHVHKIADSAAASFRRLQQLPTLHPKIATMLFCGTGLATYACRTSNPSMVAVRRIDDSLVLALCDALGVPPDEPTIARLRLPLSKGGFGARMMADYGQLAFIAGWAETIPLQHQLAPGLGLDADDADIRTAVAELAASHTTPDASITIALVRDHVEDVFRKARDAAQAAADGHGADVASALAAGPPQMTEAEAGGGPVMAQRAGKAKGGARRRLQKMWSMALDEALADGRRKRAGGDDPRVRATLNSCAGSFKGIAPLVDVTRLNDSYPWMRDQHFHAYARLRLGVPVYHDDGICPACNGHSDRFGHHAVTCMRSGKKQAMHFAMMNKLNGLAAVCMWSPLAEARVFVENEKRVDAVWRGLLVEPKDYPRLLPNLAVEPAPLPAPGAGLRRTAVVDFTCVSTFSLEGMRAAAAVIGGAAVRAAMQKDQKYRAETDANGQNYWLLPFAVDTFGAMESRAQHLLSDMGKQIAKRNGSSANAETAWVRRLFQCEHQRLIGAILTTMHPRVPDPVAQHSDGIAAVENAPYDAFPPEDFHIEGEPMGAALGAAAAPPTGAHDGDAGGGGGAAASERRDGASPTEGGCAAGGVRHGDNDRGDGTRGAMAPPSDRTPVGGRGELQQRQRPLTTRESDMADPALQTAAARALFPPPPAVATSMRRGGGSSGGFPAAAVPVPPLAVAPAVQSPALLDAAAEQRRRQARDTFAGADGSRAARPAATETLLAAAAPAAVGSGWDSGVVVPEVDNSALCGEMLGSGSGGHE
jgi:hypothetical protein